MGIEQTITELQKVSAEQTAASNNLALEVSGKVDQINQALAKAVEVAPTMQRRFYIDPTRGDDANDGSTDTPFSTVNRAIELSVIGGHTEVILQQGKHLISKDITAPANVMFYIYPASGGNEKNTELHFSERVSNEYSYVSSLWMQGGYVHIQGIKVSTGMQSDSSTQLAPYSCIQSRYGASVTITAGVIELGDFSLLSNTHSWSARADLTSFGITYVSKITRVGKGHAIKFEGFASLYSVANVLEGVSWNDIVFGNRSNCLNNMNLS